MLYYNQVSCPKCFQTWEIQIVSLFPKWVFRTIKLCIVLKLNTRCWSEYTVLLRKV